MRVVYSAALEAAKKGALAEERREVSAGVRPEAAEEAKEASEEVMRVALAAETLAAWAEAKQGASGGARRAVLAEGMTAVGEAGIKVDAQEES